MRLDSIFPSSIIKNKGMQRPTAVAAVAEVAATFVIKHDALASHINLVLHAHQLKHVWV